MEFKRLSDVEVVAEPAESANVLIEENGVIKKAPKTAVGGAQNNNESTEWDAVIEFCNGDDFYVNLLSGSYQNLYDKIMVEKEIPKIKVISTYYTYGHWHTVTEANAIYDDADKIIKIIWNGYGYDVYDPGMSVTIHPDNSLSYPHEFIFNMWNIRKRKNYFI